MIKKLLLLGFGGHAKSVVDSIEASGEYTIVGFSERVLDKNITYRGYEVICTDEELEAMYKSGIEYAFITIGFMGNSTLREKIMAQLKQIGYKIPIIVDPTAIVAQDVSVGAGSFIGKRAVLNAAVKVGENAIINTGAILDHETEVGDNSHIACGSVLCGQVKIGSSTLIGAGSTVIQNITIEEECIIGAGSTVLHDVVAKTKAYGVI